MAEKTFEEQIAELEKIVEKLENGDISLDESLALFEDGIKLTKSCREKLDKAEKRVKVLMKNSTGETVEEDFINDGE